MPRSALSRRVRTLYLLLAAGLVAALTFTRNEKGEITGLTISQNGSVLPAAKVN